MDQVTQQNAALVEEAAAAATALNEQAGKLNDIVTVFKVDGMRADIAQARATAVVNRPATPAAAARNATTVRAAGTSVHPIEKIALASPGNDDRWEQF